MTNIKLTTFKEKNHNKRIITKECIKDAKMYASLIEKNDENIERLKKIINEIEKQSIYYLFKKNRRLEGYQGDL